MLLRAYILKRCASAEAINLSKNVPPPALGRRKKSPDIGRAVFSYACIIKDVSSTAQKSPAVLDGRALHQVVAKHCSSEGASVLCRKNLDRLQGGIGVILQEQLLPDIEAIRYLSDKSDRWICQEQPWKGCIRERRSADQQCDEERLHGPKVCSYGTCEQQQKQA